MSGLGMQVKMIRKEAINGYASREYGNLVCCCCDAGRDGIQCGIASQEDRNGLVRSGMQAQVSRFS